ncbi:MAG: hypothetical protein CMJ34_12015 [Phycisphaerae bacterium]|nr:hypothetical protein [Phycisphaerae bacterium]
MDDRLKEVQTTDLTDSRVNHDFVDWLKTKGMNWLLAILLIACAFLGWDWYKRKQIAEKDQAWAELEAATSPAAYQGVATTHKDTGAIAEIAMLQAGDSLLRSVLTGLKPGMTADAEGSALTPEERTTYLEDADGFYEQAGTMAARRGGLPAKPIGMASLFGRAAIAEASGRIGDARTHLEAVITMSEPEFPVFADQARARLANIDAVVASSELPSTTMIHRPSEEGEAYTAPTAEGLLELFDDPANDAGEEPAAP